MHNVQESDWADEVWCGHTGMESDSDYCYTNTEKKKEEKPLSLEERLRKKINEEKNTDR